MLHTKEDLLPSLVIPHIVQVLTLLLDDVLDPASLLDKVHEVLVVNNSCEGLWLGVVHNGIDIQVRTWIGQAACWIEFSQSLPTNIPPDERVNVSVSTDSNKPTSRPNLIA